MPETVTSPASANSTHVAPSPVLHAKLAALRQRRFMVEAATGIAISIIVCLELLALLMFADWWLDFAWPVRLVLFLVQFALFNYILYRYVFRPWFRPPDDEELALQVEKAHPELASRLISSVQFAKPGSLSPGASVTLATCTVEQTEAAAASMDFASVVSLESLKKLGLAAVSVLVIAFAAFFASRAVSVDLLRRAFLADLAVPRKTRIDWITGDLMVGRGDSVQIEAAANGIIPARGELIMRSAERRDQSFEMEAGSAEKRARFARTLENVQEEFRYSVRLNDAVSPIYTVQVVPRPAVNQLECEQLPPAYSGLKAGKRSPGDLTLLAGSRLRFHATATKDLRSATVRLIGLDKRISLKLSTTNPRDLSGEFEIPAKGLTGFAFELVDTQQMKSSEGTVYRIDIVPDKPPVVKITWPERKEELVTRLAKLMVGFEIVDDFKLQRVALKYKVNTLDNGAEKIINLQLDGGATNRVKRRYEWKLGSFQPPMSEGSIVEYWIEAQDNNDVTGPGIGVSEHQVARVVTENEKRADLLNRAGDSIGVLGDLTADQEKLNRSLGTMILEKTGAR